MENILNKIKGLRKGKSFEELNLIELISSNKDLSTLSVYDIDSGEKIQISFPNIESTNIVEMYNSQRKILLASLMGIDVSTNVVTENSVESATEGATESTTEKSVEDKEDTSEPLKENESGNEEEKTSCLSEELLNSNLIVKTDVPAKKPQKSNSDKTEEEYVAYNNTYEKTSSVENLLNIMSVDYINNYTIEVGKCKGKKLSSLPENTIRFYAEKYIGKDNRAKAVAIALLERREQ